MNKYSQGKIYKIVDNTNGNIYIGSTIQKLGVRLAKHKHDYKLGKNCSSCQILKNGDYNNILIENYPCESNKELHIRERYWVENTECVNKQIPGRTRKEYNQDTDNINKKNKRQIELNTYQMSWGGRIYRDNNSLLKIDINLFR